MSDGSRDGQAPALAELLREIELLRAENTRLRDLLGTEADAVRSPAAEPTPSIPTGGLTLFEDEATGLPSVNAKSSAEAKGFDCPPLDTLFLAFRVAFRGRIVQYVGRVLRPLEGKQRIEVHGDVDANVPVLARMLMKRPGPGCRRAAPRGS